MHSALLSYVDYLEKLTTENLDRLPSYVAPNVRFKDPFNDVKGIEAMKAVFSHMFDNVENIVFRIKRSYSDLNSGCMEWTFSGKIRKKQWVFNGTTIVSFDEEGLVTAHIDYWDSGRDFYEHMPIIGWVLKYIRNRLEPRQGDSCLTQ